MSAQNPFLEVFKEVSPWDLLPCVGLTAVGAGFGRLTGAGSHYGAYVGFGVSVSDKMVRMLNTFEVIQKTNENVKLLIKVAGTVFIVAAPIFDTYYLAPGLFKITESFLPASIGSVVLPDFRVDCTLPQIILTAGLPLLLTYYLRTKSGEVAIKKE